jgi:hypothetical protein
MLRLEFWGTTTKRLLSVVMSRGPVVELKAHTAWNQKQPQKQQTKMDKEPKDPHPHFVVRMF